MHPVRRNRLIAVAFLLVGVAVTVTLVMRALNENMTRYEDTFGEINRPGPQT